MGIIRIRLLGDPILRRKCKAVPRVTAGDRGLIDDMMETLEDASGAGLAAPQVGVAKRIILIRSGETRESLGEVVPIINPVVARRSRETETGVEGCLSIPGIQGDVKRNLQVTVRGLNVKGKRIEVTQEGFGARALLHEIDHLDGVLFMDKLAPDSLRLIQRATNDDGEEEIILEPITVDEVHELFRRRSRRMTSEPVEAVVYS